MHIYNLYFNLYLSYIVDECLKIIEINDQAKY